MPELADTFPTGVQLDRELIAWNDGHPDFHRLGRRMLYSDRSIPSPARCSTCSLLESRSRIGRVPGCG